MSANEGKFWLWVVQKRGQAKEVTDSTQIWRRSRGSGHLTQDSRQGIDGSALALSGSLVTRYQRHPRPARNTGIADEPSVRPNSYAPQQVTCRRCVLANSSFTPETASVLIRRDGHKCTPHVSGQPRKSSPAPALPPTGGPLSLMRRRA